jgi:sigma54-dependent transcription regulator
MALRLRYEEIEVDIIETNVDQALERFCIQTGDKVVFATYTAMLHMHATLSRKAGKEL